MCKQTMAATERGEGMRADWLGHWLWFWLGLWLWLWLLLWFVHAAEGLRAEGLGTDTLVASGDMPDNVQLRARNTAGNRKKRDTAGNRQARTHKVHLPPPAASTKQAAPRQAKQERQRSFC